MTGKLTLTRPQMRALERYGASDGTFKGSFLLFISGETKWHSTIARALAARGLLEPFSEPYRGMYRITPAGRAVLAALTPRPIEPLPASDSSASSNMEGVKP